MEILDEKPCIENDAITTFVKACHRVSGLAQFRSHIYPKLQEVLPHTMFACGKVRISDLRIVESINLTFPTDYLIETNDKTNPVLRRWISLRNPVYVDADSLLRLPWDRSWLEHFKQYNVRNIAMHGVADLNQKYASYFAFGGIGCWTEYEEFMLQLLVPQLHCAFAHLNNVSDLPPKKVLTKREAEVLKWVSAGKSNAEIADILNISPWTVKIHVSNLISKLNASNRCHAAAKAIDCGLLEV
jgi:DNA-binding CsgD family transcriptional regulator